MKRVLIAVFVLAAIVGTSVPASASLVTYTAAMGGFTYDSDVQNASFLAALGGGYTHISFLGATNTDGSSYSALVNFSTMVGAFGGSNTGLVNAAGEIGPFGTWDGTLNIDFLAYGNTVGAVGFGLVEFNTLVETIRIYNASNVLIGTFNNQLLGGIFSLWGVAGNAGERIGRVELDGNFFAIQDIEFSQVQPVPEPASIVLLGLGLAGLAGAATRRKA